MPMLSIEKNDSKEMTNKLTFGLLINNFILESWQADVIRLLQKEGHILKVVIQNDNPPAKIPLLKRLQNYPWNKVVFKIWHRFIFKPDSKKSEDISILVSKASIFKCKTVQKGSAQIFDVNDIQLIAQLKLDFLLRFGFNIIRGEILKTARFGVWSFHHDDETIIRGGPPGFWEVYNKMEANGVILQQLTDSLDKGIILKKIQLPVIRHSYKAHLNSIYNNSTMLPVLVSRGIQYGNFDAEPSVSEAVVFHPPGNMKMLFFFAKMAYRRLFFHLNDIFRQEDWNIGLIKTSLINFVSSPEEHLKQVKWFSKIKNSCYLADPFLIDYKGDTLLFAEKFDYKKGKGHLVKAKASENFSVFKPVHSEKHHFSFPFLFNWNEKLYCLPECFESEGVQLYSYNIVSEQLVHEKCILDGFRAVDPVLFEHEKRWWLLFTTKDLPSVNLYAFYASSPFGPFEAHSQNPIKTDIRAARNAGSPFIFNNILVRPSQDCSGHYGKATYLNEIITLTPDRFEEEIFQKIHPEKNSHFRFGLHTLNGTDKFAVIDGKRFAFTFAGFKHQLLLKLHRR
jgi:hypothetical protein